MKLRNKKTGKIYNACNIWFGESVGDLEKTKWKTLKEFCEDWEDYKPTDPLIKDEKIRNAVRAWAKAVGICECKYDDFWKAFRYDEYYIGFSYKFTPKFGELVDGRVYTIAKLCGEDEV